ncbi:hypothetical protein N9491_06025 [Planktomarina temperata]|nr:hypothetical protein [Planktomarina temperata]
MNDKVVKRIQIAIAAFGLVLFSNGVHQLAFALGAADGLMLKANSLIMICGGICAVVLMVRR